MFIKVKEQTSYCVTTVKASGVVIPRTSLQSTRHVSQQMQQAQRQRCSAAAPGLKRTAAGGDPRASAGQEDSATSARIDQQPASVISFPSPRSTRVAPRVCQSRDRPKAPTARPRTAVSLQPPKTANCLYPLGTRPRPSPDVHCALSASSSGGR